MPSLDSAIVLIAVACDDHMLAAGMLVMHPGQGCAVAASALRVTLRARTAHGDEIGAVLEAGQLVRDEARDRDTRGAPMIAALEQVEQQIDGELPRLADLDHTTLGDADPAAEVAALFATARTLTDPGGRDGNLITMACELRVCRAPRRARIRYRVVRRPRGGAS